MPMTEPSGNLADALFDGLLEGDIFEIPTLDLNDSTYGEAPDGTSDIHDPIARLEEANLTSRTVGGSGMFDALMASVGAHLKGEFQANRITGKEYTTAYIALVQSALGSAVQYLLSSDQAFWQSRLTQEQAKLAEIETVTAKVNLDLVKMKLAAARQEVSILKANFALTKMKLATEDASFRNIEAQLAQTTYQTSTLLPAQKLGVDAQTAQTTYQTTTLLPAQKLGVEADTAVKNYQLTTLLPAQRELIFEQHQTARGQTLDNRSDGTTIVGAIGKQKALYTQQIESYKRDSEYKVAKLYHDTWTISKTMDEGWPTPGSLNETRIDEIFGQLRAKAGYV